MPEDLYPPDYSFQTPQQFYFLLNREHTIAYFFVQLRRFANARTLIWKLVDRHPAKLPGRHIDRSSKALLFQFAAQLSI